jgi:hypothetical protein
VALPIDSRRTYSKSIESIPPTLAHPARRSTPSVQMARAAVPRKQPIFTLRDAKEGKGKALNELSAASMTNGKGAACGTPKQRQLTTVNLQQS